MYRLDKTSCLAVTDGELRLSEFKSRLRKEGLYFGYHPCDATDRPLKDYLKSRAPNLYHFKFGSIADLTSSVRAELPSGNSFKIKDAPRSATGPDFNRLVIGSGDAWGSIREITFRICTLPESLRCLLIAVPSREAAQRAVSRFVGAFVKPLFFRHVPFEALPRAPLIKTLTGKRSSDILVFCLSGPAFRVAVEEEIVREYCAGRNHESKTLDIAEKHDLLDHLIFNESAYGEIAGQYAAFLWPASDRSAQDMLEKKFAADSQGGEHVRRT